VSARGDAQEREVREREEGDAAEVGGAAGGDEPAVVVEPACLSLGMIISRPVASPHGVRRAHWESTPQAHGPGEERAIGTVVDYCSDIVLSAVCLMTAGPWSESLTERSKPRIHAASVEAKLKGQVYVITCLPKA
jgi:hypothetical protein